MSDAGGRVAVYEELLRRFASGTRAAQLYAPDHSLLSRNVEGLLDALRTLHQHLPAVTIGIVDREFVVADTPLAKASVGMKDLIERLLANKVERLSFERGVNPEEIVDLMLGVGKLSRKGADAPPVWRFPHIRVGRITSEEHGKDGVASDMAAIRRLYSTAVSAAEAAWESAAAGGRPDVPAALHAVEDLADAVATNRTALLALTAMRSYDNYTFTHMVNVSILTMAQARGLGIEGRPLREFGLSALMHDIGKVRTPKEILQKPEGLTEQEAVILRRHPMEGAEILRCTPEMPILAPIVAFEHHLRLDGTGYPEGAQRNALNLGTMISNISDVYDALRSHRPYRQAFPTDRVLAVLRQDHEARFEAHLVRRFVQLLGIYPPGTLVKLSSGSIGVVTRIHAPDPHRPRVKLLFGQDGACDDAVFERNLWERNPDGSFVDSVVGPVEPELYGVDPLDFLEVAGA